MRRNNGWAAILITLLALSWLTPARAQASDPHVHLVWANFGDPAETCHTGDRFMTVGLAERHTLLACVFTDDDSPLDTSNSDLVLEWRVTPSGVAAISSAVTETDQSGTATARVTSEDLGSTNIEVSLCGDPSCMTILSTDTAIISVVSDTEPNCNDGIDNDGDGHTDHPADPECDSIQHDEETKCADSRDNDNDGDFDYPEDPGCVSIDDDTEEEGGRTEDVPPAACDGFASVIFGFAGHSEVLRGTSGPDCIFGGGGNDIIYGREGSDLIIGGAGNDLISGNPGADDLRGKAGDDEIQGHRGDDTLLGGRGRDSLDGGPGSDACSNGPHPERCE